MSSAARLTRLERQHAKRTKSFDIGAQQQRQAQLRDCLLLRLDAIRNGDPLPPWPMASHTDQERLHAAGAKERLIARLERRTA